MRAPASPSRGLSLVAEPVLRGGPEDARGDSRRELATVIAAPVCAALLADNGADVVKIENPRKPDFARGGEKGRPGEDG